MRIWPKTFFLLGTLSLGTLVWDLESDWIFPKNSYGTSSPVWKYWSRGNWEIESVPPGSPPDTALMPDAQTLLRDIQLGKWRKYSSHISWGDRYEHFTERNMLLNIREIQSVPPRSHPHTVLVLDQPHLYPLPPPSSSMELRVYCCWGSIPLRKHIKMFLVLQFIKPMLDTSSGYIFLLSMIVCAVAAVYQRSSIAQVCEEVQFVWLLAACGRHRDKKVRI